jgi:hypothetical protein
MTDSATFTLLSKVKNKEESPRRRKRPFIFLFTGDSGEQYGYKDHWTEDGVFLYTGEGQVGGMEFVRGVRTVTEKFITERKALALIVGCKKGCALSKRNAT